MSGGNDNHSLLFLLIPSPSPSLCPPVGEAKHDEGREEEDLLFSVVSPDSNSVYVVVSLRPRQENRGGDQTREERSVISPVALCHIPETCRDRFETFHRFWL